MQTWTADASYGIAALTAVACGLMDSERLAILVARAGRLLPVVSCDMISYAAGPSRLQAWRLRHWAGLFRQASCLPVFGGGNGGQRPARDIDNSRSRLHNGLAAARVGHAENV